jgi:hypothetical protein
MQALEALTLDAGDLVKVAGTGDGQVEEVSSIESNGRVRFKGGMGASAWPDLLTVCFKKGDDGDAAHKLRKIAANNAALRARTGEWSAAKQSELEKFEVRASLTRDDLDDLRIAIARAQDEKPLQQFLEARPHILTSLLTGSPRFCLPQPRLGAERVPDFLVADVDSLGVRWVLVELEAPTSSVTLANQNVFEKRARKGVSQVEEWREWLLNNLDYARRSRRQAGLGLFDIRPTSDALVLVGRRTLLHDNAAEVRQAPRERRIHVHTYDWLLQQLDGYSHLAVRQAQTLTFFSATNTRQAAGHLLLSS